ncbi:hypothetical protein RND81_05G235400 [Saponaria officinalis]|uniref:Uncharacterized protein n=1 Tax=Saponaria officinalis TaxID=3572 RepID=A0AAW1KVN0_SAPOF
MSFKKRKIEKGSMGKKENGVQQLANSIRRRFEELPPLSTKCCIYRVPRTLRSVNSCAYKPYVISIGPLHHGIKRLQGMQEHKLRYVQNFLRRNEGLTLKDYLRAIKGLENEARECYIESVSLSSDEFVEMMFVDGCFVIEFFVNWHWEVSDEHDRIFGKPSLEHVIRRDLLLIENQLPFFVLEHLYDLAFKNESPESFTPFADLTSEVLIGERDLPEKFKSNQILHFVDFMRTYFLPSNRRDLTRVPPHDIEWDFPPSVRDLHDAGVQFMTNKHSPLLDVKFENGILYIPKLDVEDHTEALLLNLSAFEQCHYNFDSYIVDYILLIDVLITTLKDVDILISNGIVSNSLGNNDDVARLFNTICRETSYEAHKFYYTELCKELVVHSKAPWNKWKATLRHDYFNNPWTIISVIAAFVLLILTIVQTACSVISIKR